MRRETCFQERISVKVWGLTVGQGSRDAGARRRGREVGAMTGARRWGGMRCPDSGSPDSDVRDYQRRPRQGMRTVAKELPR